MSNSNESSSKTFVNHGLQRWENQRKTWCSPNNNNNNSSQSTKSRKLSNFSQPVDVDATIDYLFSNRWRAELAANTSHGRERVGLRRPVPLPMMVDILVDLWEAEGLDP